MHDLVKQLAEHLKFIEDTPVVVAYSGGVDSCVLLSALVELKQSGRMANDLHVCHVNHGLSEFADDWQHHAEQLCHAYQIPFISQRLNLKVENRQSLEAVARDARYQVLGDVATKLKAVVLTGHHLDDQTETFLLALKRGAGVKGLSAMRADVTLHEYALRIIRPLLNVSREQIESYAREKALTWVEDDSNTDTQFDRNFLRQQVIPQLVARWPSITTTIARSTEHCQSAHELLNELAYEDLQQFDNANGSLSQTILERLSDNRINNLLRYWISLRTSIMPSQTQLVEVVKQVRAQCDKQPAIKVGELWLRRFQQGLYLTPEFSDVSGWQKSLSIDALKQASTIAVQLPDNSGSLQVALTAKPVSSAAVRKPTTAKTQIAISIPQGSSALTIAFSHENPTCLPDYRQHSRKLKKVLQELKIPTWQRQRIPLIFLEEELVAVAGYFVCQPYLPNNHVTNLSIDWFTQ